MAIINEEPAKAASLVASIQKLTEANAEKRLRTFVVFVAGPEVKPEIEKVAAEKGIKIPMVFLAGGKQASDFAPYKFNPEAKNTVLLYNRQTVVKNFVDVTEKTFPDVEKATKEMLGE